MASFQFEVKKEDCWIGVYWKTTRFPSSQPDKDLMLRDIWICFLPMIPLHIAYSWEQSNIERKREVSQALAELTQMSQDLGLYDQ